MVAVVVDCVGIAPEFGVEEEKGEIYPISLGRMNCTYFDALSSLFFVQGQSSLVLNIYLYLDCW